MGRLVNQDFTSWTEGVNNSAQPDDLNPNMFSLGINTQLKNISAGKAVVAARPPVYSVSPDKPVASAVRSLFHIKIAGVEYGLSLHANKNLWKFTIPTGTPVLVSAAAVSTDVVKNHTWVMAKNVAFFTNGVDQISYNGTALGGWGLTRPTIGAMASGIGGVGLHNGTYELRVTFGISSLDVESSASDTAITTVTVANQQITWGSVPNPIPVSADPRVDRRYLYVRNVATMTNFYLAGTINDNTTTTATTSIADATMTIIAPTTSENEPPPTGIKYAVWHKNRMFVATDSVVYWSNLNAPTEFNLLQSYANPNLTDGEKITGLAVFNDLLVIFKERSTYAIIGDDPNSWTIKQLFPAMGCIASRSIIVNEGILYWWSMQGPIMWQGEGEPVNIGTPFIADTIKWYLKNALDTHEVVGGVDRDGQRILWTCEVPVDSKQTQNVLLPFNYRVGRWEATYWHVVNVKSMVNLLDTSADQADNLYLGGEYGHVVYFKDSQLGDILSWDGFLLTKDEIFAQGTIAIPGGGSFTKLTGVFDVVNKDYVGASVAIYTSTGQFVTIRYVSAAVANELTLDKAVSLADSATYTWVLQGHAFVFNLPWWDFGEPFKKKWLKHVYTLADGANVTLPTKLLVWVDGDSIPRFSTTLDFSNNNRLMDPNRTRVDVTGRTVLVGYVQSGWEYDRPLFMGIQQVAEVLSDKLE